MLVCRRNVLDFDLGKKHCMYFWIHSRHQIAGKMCVCVRVCVRVCVHINHLIRIEFTTDNIMNTLYRCALSVYPVYVLRRRKVKEALYVVLDTQVSCHQKVSKFRRCDGNCWI